MSIVGDLWHQTWERLGLNRIRQGLLDGMNFRPDVRELCWLRVRTREDAQARARLRGRRKLARPPVIDDSQ